MSDQIIPPGVDPTRPSAGRMYDYYLGGTEHLEIDRMAADQLYEKIPDLPDTAWANRGFLQRAASWLVTEHGVDQFIDIGAGLPTRNNTHEAAQKVNPEARVAYVDNDPMVLAHAQSLLVGTEHTTFLAGDFRDPDTLLSNPDLRRLIDFSRPVGLMVVALTHFVSDDDDPAALLRRYLDEVPSGSYLALSHITSDKQPDEAVQRFRDIYANATEHLYFRTKQQITALFDGLEIVPPYADGKPELTYLGQWGADDPAAADSDGGRWGYCAVARKP